MSTRATYQINDTIFYIHHDGYVEGAAAYLLNMCRACNVIDNTGESFQVIDQGQTRGGLEFAFIRGNGNCEPTDSHEAHTDTEYRYVVTSAKSLSFMDSEPMLKAYAKVYFEVSLGGSNDYNWRLIYDGKLTDFINKYVGDPAFNSISGGSKGVLFTKIDNQSNETLFCTVEQGSEAAKGFSKKALTYDADNPNRERNEERALTIDEAVRNFSKNPREAA